MYTKYKKLKCSQLISSTDNKPDYFFKSWNEAVYINRDLTPAEAKMAYEKRQQRRLKRAASSS